MADNTNLVGRLVADVGDLVVLCGRRDFIGSTKFRVAGYVKEITRNRVTLS